MQMMPQRVDIYLRFDFGGTSCFVVRIEPDFANLSKTCVIVNEQFSDFLMRPLQYSKVLEFQLAFGSPSFVDSSFVEGRVSTWIKELHLLSNISVTHSHATYADRFIHGFICKRNF